MSRMIKGLKPIPKFGSEREEADFWARHDTTAYAFKEIEEKIELSPRLRQRLNALRRERGKAVVELEPQQMEKAQQIARHKQVGYKALVRRWIEEGIRREGTGK
ncbi:MAG: CopG family antitoxin [Candidatus Methylomirabilales bacterium]